MTSFGFVIPNLKLTSELNAREHWRARAKRVKEQRELVAAYWRAARAGKPVLELPIEIEITRVAPRLLDSDNAVGAAKHVRDELAKQMLFDDRNPHVVWVVRQRQGYARQYAVEVRVVWL